MNIAFLSRTSKEFYRLVHFTLFLQKEIDYSLSVQLLVRSRLSIIFYLGNVVFHVGFNRQGSRSLNKQHLQTFISID